jgi:SAM-dependent methyltransferase
MSRLTLDDEVAMLSRYASASRLGVLEIGCYLGGTTAELCRAAINGEGAWVYGIDPIIADLYGQVGDEAAIRAATAFYPKFTFYRAPSHPTSQAWKYQLGLIFVDGDHRYESVREDFLDWWPHLAPGGHMAFHDSLDSERPGFVGHAGAMRFVDELVAAGYPELVETVGTTRVFRK